MAEGVPEQMPPAEAVEAPVPAAAVNAAASTTEQSVPAALPSDSELAAPVVAAAEAVAAEVVAEAVAEATAEMIDEAAVAETISEEDIKSKRVTLADLSAKGSALYAHQNYEDACEIFSRASVLQAEINGELDPDNAEILFHYGRSLFKVGQSKSDVLGAPAAAAEKAVAKPAGNGTAAKAGGSKDAEAGPATPKDTKPDLANKPLIQFSGDENLDDSNAQDDEGGEGDEDDGNEDEDGEEENDDLATAFEILDLARVCYLKKLEALTAEAQSSDDKGKETAQQQDSPTARHVKERLADTHDCLAEIALENEQYPSAIEDGRVSLTYKMELYPPESEIVAEAHYKLSLALEFASITMSGEDGKNTKREAMDQGLRDEAIKEMELAIESFKLKMQAKEVELATMASPEDNDVARKAIADMKEVAADMEQRLVDLRKDPIGIDDIGGILSGALGGEASASKSMSNEDAQARADEAAKNATDLTSMVRKRVKEELASGSIGSGSGGSNGKRKADEALSPPGAADVTGITADGEVATAGAVSPKKPRLADDVQPEVA